MREGWLDFGCGFDVQLLHPLDSLRVVKSITPLQRQGLVDLSGFRVCRGGEGPDVGRRERSGELCSRDISTAGIGAACV